MSATVPITNGQMQAGAQIFAPLGGEAGPGMGSVAVAGVSPRSTSGFQTNHAVGGTLLGFGVLLLVLHLSGFRLAFDVGLGRG